MTLYCYDGPKGWGRRVAKEAGGILFSDPDKVPDGAKVYVRLDQQHPETMEIYDRLYGRMCIMTPSVEERILYDNKIEQLGILKSFMPETRLYRSLRWALHRAGEQEYPIISKASTGASSANVRILHSQQEAEAEAGQAFGDGIPLKYGRLQQGYVYWQRFVSDNPCDYRVCIVGDNLYGAVQYNRSDTPLASGSGKGRPMDLSTERERQACALATTIAQGMGWSLMAFDILFDGDKPLVTEVSCSWGVRITAKSKIYNWQTMRDTGMVAYTHLYRLMAALAESKG
jgi:glutathione synthase/RimK-type ligase-like ATP-grasp enzyme